MSWMLLAAAHPPGGPSRAPKGAVRLRLAIGAVVIGGALVVIFAQPGSQGPRAPAAGGADVPARPAGDFPALWGVDRAPAERKDPKETPAPGEHPVAGSPERRFDLTGVVTDVRSEPVGGAQVWVRAEGRPWLEPPRASGVCDAEGRFRLAGARPEEEPHALTVLAKAPGFLPGRATPALDGAGAGEVHITLERGLALRGTVVTPGGQPVAGAVVEAHGARAEDVRAVGRHRLWGPAWAPNHGQTTSTEDGTFVLAGLAPGSLRLVASRPGYVQRTEVRATVPAAADAPVIVLVLYPLALLDVRVVDAETGAPVVTAGVSLRKRGGLPVPYQPPDLRAHEDAHGPTVFGGRMQASVLLPAVDAAPVQAECRIVAPGYRPTRTQLTYRPWPGEPVQVPVARELDLIPVDVSVVVEGTARLPTCVLNLVLRHEAGAVECVVPMRFREGRPAAPLPLAVGRYSIGVRGATGASTFWGEAAPGRPFEVGADARAIRCVLRGGGLRLRVSDRTGESIPEYVVVVNGDHVSGTLATWEDAEFAAAESEERTFWLAPGAYRVGVSKPGFRTEVREVTVRDGGSTALDVVLAPEE